MATSKDRAVLQAILNPSAPFGDILGFAEEEEAAAVQGEEGAFTSELLEQVKELELQGVLAAESGDVNRALEKFSQAIQLLPERASCYNNRAQAFRLKGDVAGALQDLDTALHLSRGTGHVACQCFVQRGLLSLLQGHKDKARLDFEQAAGLGSAFARHQLVLMNPYSALCNQMLSEVMRKLQNPDIQGSN
uniref:Tetratricopeptide repeat protein 36 n=1 Tax=Pelodiscus sinensis TaxID=13735 RepID=K7FI22_PELSI|nr:tetratricopeptide repeat protein 36 isoform X1 [Pelodiscus sinensis]|eukprot:XP_006121009.1 tetratricopeptide repeat protein 36 isoform X1 [Pelodiscus sinensis]